jgi:hypothetical protein
MFLGIRGQFLLVGSSTCLPVQTSPKNFISPLLFICTSKSYEICTHVKLILSHKKFKI